jgi:hypothetical protein
MSEADIIKQIAEGANYRTLVDRLMRDVINGLYQPGLPPVLHRYIALEVFSNPVSELDDEKYAALHEKYDFSDEINWRDLPIGTILAVKQQDGTSQSRGRFVYPIFSSHLQLPIKPGEHIWVMFETLIDQAIQRAYYIGRIHEPRSVEDANHTHAPRAWCAAANPLESDEPGKPPQYNFANGVATVDPADGSVYVSPETAPLPGGETAYEDLLQTSATSASHKRQSVPRFHKPPPDAAVMGSNNTLIHLGTLEQGDTKEGIIDTVVGRGRTPETAPLTVENSLKETEADKSNGNENPNEGNADYTNDAARVMLCINVNLDDLFKLSLQNSGVSGSDGSGIVIKADHLRFIARKSCMITVKGSSKDPTTGIEVESDDPTTWCSFGVVDGNFIFKPSETGYIKLGGADANQAILCTSQPAAAAGGTVTAPPTISTMGGAIGTGVPSQGGYSKKVLIK